MVFSSLVFLFAFLPAVLLINHFLPAKAKNLILLLANLIFYAYGEPVYVVLMILSVALNYIAAKHIELSPSPLSRKITLVLSIVLNLGSLAFFKYTPLVFDTLRHLSVFSNIPDFKITLPIGISFYTFQAMSYVIDVYRGDNRIARNFVDFAAYISLFPQLIAGPIVRYGDVDRQMRERRVGTEMFSTGVRLFCIGLAKKVLLANKLGLLWNTVSADVTDYGMAGAWIGAFSYALQIYFDFAGYSDMARGLGKMLGFDFCINFNYPYISKSITEFWRRWHISLSTWFRDYLYIPLGGNRRGKVRMCFNILVVWALTGLWHGAGWNFLAWGVYYAILLLGEKMLYGKKLESAPNVVSRTYTIVAVVIGWVLFASNNFKEAFFYIKAMFTPNFADVTCLFGYGVIFAASIFASTPVASRVWNMLKKKSRLTAAEALLCALALILCTASLVTESYNPFLYFRF